MTKAKEFSEGQRVYVKDTGEGTIIYNLSAQYFIRFEDNVFHYVLKKDAHTITAVE